VSELLRIRVLRSNSILPIPYWTVPSTFVCVSSRIVQNVCVSELLRIRVLRSNSLLPIPYWTIPSTFVCVTQE